MDPELSCEASSPEMQGSGWLRPTTERVKTHGLGRQASSWIPSNAVRESSSPESGCSQAPTTLEGGFRVRDGGSGRPPASLRPFSTAGLSPTTV